MLFRGDPATASARADQILVHSVLIWSGRPASLGEGQDGDAGSPLLAPPRGLGLCFLTVGGGTIGLLAWMFSWWSSQSVSGGSSGLPMGLQAFFLVLLCLFFRM